MFATRLLGVLLVCVSAFAHAAGDAEAVLDMERGLWSAWKAHDLAAIEAVTALDYYSIDEQGPSHAIGLTEIRRDFPTYALKDFKLGPMTARIIAPNTIVIVYNAHIFGSARGKDVSRGVAEASVWTKRLGGKWRNVLLHEVTRSQRDAAVDP